MTDSISTSPAAERAVLVIDVGGSHVKFAIPGAPPRRFTSGHTISAEVMATRVLVQSSDWHFDAESIGFPGPGLQGRIAAEPHNLGKGWAGFDFTAAFGKPVRLINISSWLLDLTAAALAEDPSLGGCAGRVSDSGEG